MLPQGSTDPSPFGRNGPCEEAVALPAYSPVESVVLSLIDPVVSLNVKGAGSIFPAAEEFKVKSVLKELNKGPHVSLFLFLKWFL